jgi:hypothetical protein
MFRPLKKYPSRDIVPLSFRRQGSVVDSTTELYWILNGVWICIQEEKIKCGQMKYGSGSVLGMRIRIRRSVEVEQN